MKKRFYLVLIVFLGFCSLFGQYSSSVCPISYVHSPNNKFKVVSVAFDNEFPSLRGESYVLKQGGVLHDTVYKVPRAFDLDKASRVFLFISNDGNKILYISEVNCIGAGSKLEKNKVTVYEKGKLIKSYDIQEFTGCDKRNENCNLFYEQGDYQKKIKDNTIIDVKNSSSNLVAYQEGTDEKDIFLADNFLLNKNDTIYIIDSRKKVVIFDLNNLKIIKNNIDFDSVYPSIKYFRGKSNCFSDSYLYPYKSVSDIINADNGQMLSHEIAKLFNLKYVSRKDPSCLKFNNYKFNLYGYLNRNGRFEIESLEVDSVFDEKTIRDYLNNVIYNADFMPLKTNKIYLEGFQGVYRSLNDSIVEKETLREKEIELEIYQKRLISEKINGVYIPKDICECMDELDKMLDFESKTALCSSNDAFDFNSHMGGLGMWIRNNWGINGGSRLLEYFKIRGIKGTLWGNENVSGIIIETYINWFKGDKQVCMKWETENPIIDNKE